MMKEKQEYTKYEIARILGARALQISMNAPLLLKISKEKMEEVNYNPLKLAKLEFESGVLPITVRRPMPQRTETKEEEEAKSVVEEIVEEAEKIEVQEKKAVKKEVQEKPVEEIKAIDVNGADELEPIEEKEEPEAEAE